MLAALTGAVFRASMAWGLDTGATLTNLRHAHSHAMFFAWVTPALMTLVAALLPRLTGRPTSRAMVRAIASTIVLGVVSHPFFALFGYSSVTIGAARIPPAVIVAALNMLAWYAFALEYARATWGARRVDARQRGALVAWDLAVAMLLLSTVAAWALALVRPLGLEPARWQPVLVHAFLDPFAEGWLPLAVLGVLHAVRPQPAGSERILGLVAIAIGAPLAFGLAAPRELLPDGVRVLSAAGAIVWAGGLLSQLALFARDARELRIGVPLAFGAAAALARGFTGTAPGIDWMAFDGLRLLYLHALLVGLVSLSLFSLAREALGASAVRRLAAIEVALVALIASLVPFTPAWPDAWRGEAVMSVAAIVALIAAGAGISVLVPRVGSRARLEPTVAHT